MPRTYDETRAELKRIAAHNRNDRDNLVRDARTEAWDKLDSKDKHVLEGSKQAIRKIPKVGDDISEEILMALGMLLNDYDEKRVRRNGKK